MPDLISLFVIFTLIGVIIIQAVERYFYAAQNETERSRLIAAILSKDISEYTHAIRVDKEKAPPGFKSPDEVELSNADDDVFDKFIQGQTK